MTRIRFSLLFMLCISASQLWTSCNKIDDIFSSDPLSDLSPSEWAPENLILNRTGLTKIELSWDYEGYTIQGFIIERKLGTSDWIEVMKTADLKFEEDNLELGSYLSYRICAYSNNYRSSCINDGLSFWIPSPMDFKISSDSASDLSLHWTYEFQEIDGFIIDRQVNDGNWENTYQELSSLDSDFTDHGVDFSTNDYRYRIKALYNEQYSKEEEKLIHIPEIGEFYGGGIVFYFDGNINGLICMDTDLEKRDWGCNGDIIGNTSQVLGAGKKNTKLIVDKCRESNCAARKCEYLVYNDYNDWFLPSRDELNLMYENLHLQGLGNFETFGYEGYWSSTEVMVDVWGLAIVQYFSDGDQNNNSKSSGFLVRAVRTF